MKELIYQILLKWRKKKVRLISGTILAWMFAIFMLVALYCKSLLAGFLAVLLLAAAVKIYFMTKGDSPPPRLPKMFRGRSKRNRRN